MITRLTGNRNLAEKFDNVFKCTYLMVGTQVSCMFYEASDAKNYSSPSPILPECKHCTFSRLREDGSKWDYPCCSCKEAQLHSKWKHGRGSLPNNLKNNRKKGLSINEYK